jgi:hypothetical protein
LLVKTIPNQAIPESTLIQILLLIVVLAVILAITLIATIYVIRHRKTGKDAVNWSLKTVNDSEVRVEIERRLKLLEAKTG